MLFLFHQIIFRKFYVYNYTKNYVHGWPFYHHVVKIHYPHTHSTHTYKLYFTAQKSQMIYIHCTFSVLVLGLGLSLRWSLWIMLNFSFHFFLLFVIPTYTVHVTWPHCLRSVQTREQRVITTIMMMTLCKILCECVFLCNKLVKNNILF